MATPRGLEPPTYSSGGCRSIQLSYGISLLHYTTADTEVQAKGGIFVVTSANNAY